MRFRRRTDDEIPAEAVAHLPPTPGLEGLDRNAPKRAKPTYTGHTREALFPEHGPIRSTDVLPVRKRGRRT